MKGIIYKWTCMESGKSYIGQTINEERREKEFFSKSEPYTKESSKIDNARKKYSLSRDMWKKEVLKRLWCKEGKEKDLLERLNYWEKYYIKEYDTFNNGYNSTDGGGHDYIFADELKDKLRDIGKGWWQNLSDDEKSEHIQKSKDWWNGLSDEERLSFSYKYGRCGSDWWNNLSEEEKKKFSDGCRERSKNWWDNLSDDEKNKFLDECRKRNKNWWDNLSDDEKEKHKKNASKAWLGKHRYASTCETLRQKRLGKSRSNETKEKIRNTLLNSPSAQSKKIKQFDLDGNFIKEYSSISQMLKDTGLNYKGVVRCAKGLQEKSCGYKWKFSDEYVDKPKENKGYYFYKKLGKYKARLRQNGKEYALGFYRNEKAASEMYKLALENKDNIDIWFKDIEMYKRSIIEKYE